MWTAEITNKEFREGQFKVTVLFTDDEDKSGFQEIYGFSNVENLNQTILDKLQSLEELKTAFNNLVIGPIEIEVDTIEVTPKQVKAVKTRLETNPPIINELPV